MYDRMLSAVPGQWKRRQHTPQLSTSVSDHGLCSGSSRCGQRTIHLGEGINRKRERERETEIETDRQRE